MRQAMLALIPMMLMMSAMTSARADTEEPRYTIVERRGPVEIRQYEPRLAAEVVVNGDEEDARSDGFRLLANYIFGNNRSRTKIDMTSPVAQGKNEKIDMTSPVSQDRAGNGWRVRFFMPAKFTRDTLPVPNNPAVQIVELPAETMAVLRYSNSRSAESVANHTKELMAALAQSRWKPVGTPVSWFYDPPWTLPFFRRNEVAVMVAPK